MEDFKEKKYLGIIGLICSVVGIFLPYLQVKLFGLSVGDGPSLISTWHGIVIAVALFICVLIMFTKLNQKIMLIPILVSGIVAIINYNSDTEGMYKNLVKPAIGFWVFWIGIALLFLYVFIYKGKITNNKE